MRFSIAICFIFLLSSSAILSAYPIDGYAWTGIRRLLYQQLVEQDSIQGKKLNEGATKSMEEIELYLYERSDLDSLHQLPEVDPELQKGLDRIFPHLHESYSVTLLDITPGQPMRYAKRQETRGFQPGSVGKLAVLTALFCELENIYPDCFEDRIQLLKNRQIEAGPWAVYDHHTVPVYDPKTQKRVKRQVNEKDVFSLYEWLDHMVSVSNNGAASVVWREALLMREFGADYPTLVKEKSEHFFEDTKRTKLMDMAISVVNEPLEALGISNDEWRLGQFFTRGATGIIPGKGGSIGSPLGLMKWMMELEKGNIVDPKTSLEMKRLLYLTDRRIRYASNSGLKDDGVYFKSGSLYKCNRDIDPNCAKYAGNVYNYMNSVAIVERPDSVVYLVALMTNVKGRNSAWDHNRIAGEIDKLFPTRTIVTDSISVDSVNISISEEDYSKQQTDEEDED